MKILISGGTGLVGKELGKTLSQKGHQLFVLTRSPDKANWQCPYPQTPITWEELGSSSLLPPLDAIINLAGAGVADRRWTGAYKKEIHDSRVQGTKRLVDLACERCPKLSVFISTSAIGIYDSPHGELLPEEAPQSQGFLGQLCQDWEAAAQGLKEGVRTLILRVGVVFSEKGGALAKMVPPIQGGYGGFLGDGQQYMSWIDREDLTNMYVFALENKIQGTFNATAPQPETNRAITKHIAQRLGVRGGPRVPYLALRLGLGEAASHFVESQKVSSAKIQKAGFQFECQQVHESIGKRVPLLKGSEKRLIFQQWLPLSKEELFPFFSDAKNLEQITPPSLRFKILNTSTETIQSGTEINYRLRIDGVPVRWRTLIKDWKPPHMFSDNQEKGPYKKWYHTHLFEDLAHGTLMTDQVDMILPLGLLGSLALSWKVFRDVEKIFQYRKKIIHDLFKEGSSQVSGRRGGWTGPATESNGCRA